MICKNCGEVIPDSSQVCPKCGTQNPDLYTHSNVPYGDAPSAFSSPYEAPNGSYPPPVTPSPYPSSPSSYPAQAPYAPQPGYQPPFSPKKPKASPVLVIVVGVVCAVVFFFLGMLVGDSMNQEEHSWWGESSSPSSSYGGEESTPDYFREGGELNPYVEGQTVTIDTYMYREDGDLYDCTAALTMTSLLRGDEAAEEILALGGSMDGVGTNQEYLVAHFTVDVLDTQDGEPVFFSPYDFAVQDLNGGSVLNYPNNGISFSEPLVSAGDQVEIVVFGIVDQSADPVIYIWTVDDYVHFGNP